MQSERLRRLVNALILTFVSILPPIFLHFDATLWPAAGKIALPTKGLDQFFPFFFSLLSSSVIFLSFGVLTFRAGWPYKALIERGAAALLALVPLALSFLD